MEIRRETIQWTFAGATLTDAAFYKQVVFETRVFEKKHYLYPIPSVEIFKDAQLVQNPSW